MDDAWEPYILPHMSPWGHVFKSKKKKKKEDEVQGAANFHLKII
jgi:hypothetical protein